MPNVGSTLLYQWFTEVWNNGDESAIDRMMDANAIAHGITEAGGASGPEGFKVFYRNFTNQFSPVSIRVDEVVSEDGMETARCVVTATERETGKAVQFHGICMARTANGKITEAWNNFDFLDMYQQLGHRLVADQT